MHTNNVSFYWEEQAKFFGNTCLHHLRWCTVSCCVVSTSERHQRIRSLPRLLPVLTHLTICGTKWEPQKTFPLWHGALVAGIAHSKKDLVFFSDRFLSAWVFAWIYSKDLQARRIGGSKLPNGVNLSQLVCL